MGLFLCDLCDGHLDGNDIHICDRDRIRYKFHNLESQRRTAEQRLRMIQDRTMKLIDNVGSLDVDEITINPKLLNDLWIATDCKHTGLTWRDSDTANSFLVKSMSPHRVLCEAFSLFRAKKYGHQQTLLQKLTDLHDRCEDAKQTLGYQDSKFDMSPQDIVDAADPASDCSIMDLPRGADDSDPQWQLGYKDGENLSLPQCPNATYISGYIHGVCGLQLSPKEAVTAYRSILLTRDLWAQFNC